MIDAHILIWTLSRNPKLSRAAADALADPVGRVVLPTIALAEIRHAYHRGRSPADPPAVRILIASLPNGTVYPFDEAVLERLPPGLEFHDGIIVATALVYRDVLGEPTSVVTADPAIAGNGLIDVIW